MKYAAIIAVLLTLAACAAETGPAGGASPGGDVNPVTGTQSKGGSK
jgi:hypothetical protein